MKITREVKKQKAIELMNKLDIYKPYIKGFKDKNSVEEIGNNDYIVDYKGVKCHALFNWFVCQFYVDDIYRRVEK